LKQIKTQDSLGQILCHDVTQIIKDTKKDTVFRKGHVITESDIPILLSIGKDHVYIWDDNPDMLHENDAAEILSGICLNKNMHTTEVKEGKIELIADINGLLMVDTVRLNNVNSIGEMMIATRAAGSYVKKGDRLCGTRIIPLAIGKEKMETAKKAAGNEPLLELLPVKQKKYGLINTGNEIFYGRIKDTFTSVIQEKMSEFGCEMTTNVTLEDNYETIAAAINGMLGSGVDMVICTGGMSVDPDDKTPLAIKKAADEIISYGTPVLPGAMFMLAYMSDGRPICGLPGCAMYNKRTVFDIVLPRLLADVRITAGWLSKLGNGGLCLECESCHFPNCTFGKGV